MKIMIASDLHGSALFTRKLLDRFASEGAELLVLLGDLYYHGVRNPLPEGYAPGEVSAMLNAAADKLFVLRGNCDSAVDETVSAFPMAGTGQLLSEGRRVYLTHGDVFCMDRLPPLPAGSLFFQGHTHVSGFFDRGGILCVNPGSVSLPKEGTARGYAVLDGNKVLLKDLEENSVGERSWY